MKITRLFIIGTAVILLVGCESYKVEVDLPTEELKSIKADIASLKDDIANYVPVEVGVIAWQDIIDLSRAYEKIGELGKAIALYEEYVESGRHTKALLNNLGRLYEKTEQYDKAVVMYQRINDEYFDHDYLYDITWTYIRAKDRKNAEKYFNAWQLAFNKTDEQTQQAIKKLRAEEKES